MLQFHPDFNIRSLEAFVTPKVIDKAVVEVKEEVAATAQGLTLKATDASGGNTTTETEVSARASEVVEIENIGES